MKRETFFYELERVCSDERSDMWTLMQLLLLEDTEYPEFDVDAGDWCRKFCETHKNCEFCSDNDIRKFIKRTDELGLVDYLVYDEKTSWAIENE